MSHAGDDNFLERLGLCVNLWMILSNNIVPEFQLPTDRLEKLAHKLPSVVHKEICENSKRYYPMVEDYIRHMGSSSFRRSYC